MRIFRFLTGKVSFIQRVDEYIYTSFDTFYL